MSKFKYFYGKPADSKNSCGNALSILATHESLHSARTSSLPLAQFWCDVKPRDKSAKNLADKIQDIQNASKVTIPQSDCKWCFEYAVPVNGGKGKASMTDLMIFSDKIAIAIEAKYTECTKPYETINKWMYKDKTENKIQVLNGWWQYIRDAECTDKPCLDGDDHKIIPYQLLHRIASACAVAIDVEDGMQPRHPVVIYQLFYDEESNERGSKANITSERVKDFVTKKIKPAIERMQLKNIDFSTVMTKVNPAKDIPNENKNYDYGDLFIRMIKGESVYKIGKTTQICINDLA